MAPSDLLKFLKEIEVEPTVLEFAKKGDAPPAAAKDLFQRMAKYFPDDVTEEEREVEACTKFRWMQLNDAHSTLGTLGFRMDGLENARYKFEKMELRDLR